MSQDRYIFIARKPGSSDYCRGCLMATYSSDFICKENLTQEELLQEWAQILYANLNLRVNESGYSIQIIKGRTLLEGEFQRYQKPTLALYPAYHNEEDDQIDAENLLKLEDEARKHAEELEKIRITKETEKETKEKQLREEQEKAKRFTEFQRLKTEFEN